MLSLILNGSEREFPDGIIFGANCEYIPRDRMPKIKIIASVHGNGLIVMLFFVSGLSSVAKVLTISDSAVWYWSSAIRPWFMSEISSSCLC